MIPGPLGLGGGTGLGTLNALHATVGLGGLQQQDQLPGLLGGGAGLQIAGGVSTELAMAGLCALLGGPQSHQVTLNSMQVLQAQQAMAAQALTKQKAAEATIQAKIDAEVEKRMKDLPVQTPSLPATTKVQPDR